MARSKTVATVAQLASQLVSGHRFRPVMMARSKTVTNLIRWPRVVLEILPKMRQKSNGQVGHRCHRFRPVMMARSKTMATVAQLTHHRSSFSTRDDGQVENDDQWQHKFWTFSKRVFQQQKLVTGHRFRPVMMARSNPVTDGKNVLLLLSIIFNSKSWSPVTVFDPWWWPGRKQWPMAKIEKVVTMLVHQSVLRW